MLLVSLICTLFDAVQLRPISPDELARYDEALLLSEPQRRAATHYYGVYSEKCADLFDSVPHVPVGHPREHEVYRLQVAGITPLDDGFFEAIRNLCTPEQQEWLSLLKVARERQRYVAALSFARETGRPFVFLDEVVLTSPTIDRDEIREQLLVYAQESASHLRSLQDECYDLFDRRRERMEGIPDISLSQIEQIGQEEGEESLRIANRIDDLGMRWAQVLIDSLPSAQAADLMAQFGSAQYREAERYWLAVRVLRDLLSEDGVVPADATEFRGAVQSLFYTEAVDDFKSLVATIRSDLPRIYPFMGRWPDGSKVLANTRRAATELGSQLDALCGSEADGLGKDVLTQYREWAARRAQQESPMFDANGRLMLVQQPPGVLSAEEVRAVVAKLSLDDATNDIIALIIDEFDRSTRDLRRNGEQSSESYDALCRVCLQDIGRVLPSGVGDVAIRTALQCLDRASYYAQSTAHGFAGIDVGRLALTSEGLTPRMLADHLSTFHSKVSPILERRSNADDVVDERVRARMRGEANAQIAEASYDLINTLTLGKPGLEAERERLLRVIVPSLFFGRDSLAATYHESRDAAHDRVERERIESAWLAYLEEDDVLVGELLALASQAHSWGRTDSGVWIPQVPTREGDLIAKATQLTTRRGDIAALVERTINTER